VVAGLALFLAAAYPPTARLAVLLRQSCAIFAIALGGAVLVQHFDHLKLGIDELLFDDPYTPVDLFPGRMARATATGFAIFGLALLFTFRAPTWAFWTGFALTAAGFWASLFACLGYMFDVQTISGSRWFGDVSLHTILAFLALFAGFMLAVPNRGWARIVLTDKLGGVVARRLLPLMAIVPLAILWLAQQGAHAGLYSERASEYIAAVALIIVLTTVVIVMCGRLNVVDAHRRVMQDGRNRAQAQAVRMRHMAELDALTDLWNRRHFLAEAEARIAAAHAGASPLALLMIDIDHFKRINDTHGHAAGDKALRLIAATLKDFTRKADCAARLGGEEFAVLLPGVTRTLAENIAQRICEQVARLAILDGEGRRFGLTVSIGMTECAAADTRPEGLMARADAALYEAKRGGRNRVEIAFTPERSAA
ncbi:MAG: diguanylate cyclase domain-containing protein, partial [Alphaproteobacteria bacterium]